jgi:crotonobetaine/carnitine-CoA ligase
LQRTIPQLLADAAARTPDRIWLRTDDVQLTFAETAGEVGGACAQLAEKGVGHGDLVMFTAHNTPACLLTWLAISALGATAVPVNPASTPVEIGGLLEQISPRLVISDPSELGGTHADLPTGKAQPADIAILIPTSGTTGRSKLVMQTHRAYVMAGEGFPFWMELDDSDRLMTSLPLFHVNAPAYSVLGSLACGAGLVLLSRFSASDFIDAARRHGATEFNAIGAMLEILMRQPRRPDDADNPVRRVYTGPAPDRERHLEIEERFGLQIVCGYGMSESPFGLIWPHGTRLYGTLGTVRQHPTLGVVNEAKVVDEVGNPVAAGEVGELLMRNPTITPGYYGMPEETAAAVTPDGWLHTGDLVTGDEDGVYTFVARKKEVLRRRGENLSPAEVEEAIASHPSVVEVAVVGVASDLSEDDIKAFVVLRADVDWAELREWAAARLSPFKVPRYWQQLDALPRTPTQRVAKHQLPTGHPEGEYDTETPP